MDALVPTICRKCEEEGIIHVTLRSKRQHLGLAPPTAQCVGWRALHKPQAGGTLLVPVLRNKSGVV